jgi:hypothetical protein
MTAAPLVADGLFHYRMSGGEFGARVDGWDAQTGQQADLSQSPDPASPVTNPGPGTTGTVAAALPGLPVLRSGAAHRLLGH